MMRRLRLRSPVSALVGAAAAMASLTNIACADGLFRRQSSPSNPGDEDNLGVTEPPK
jgi:ATPase family AAA domain-containing protein 3A/B